MAKYYLCTKKNIYMNEENTAKRLGAQMRLLREGKGMKTEDIARLLDHDRSYVSKIEGGQSTTLDNMDRFLATLGCRLGIVDIETGEVPTALKGDMETASPAPLSAEQIVRIVAASLNVNIRIEDNSSTQER